MLETEKDILRSVVSKIEKLEEDKNLITQHLRDIYAEMKDKGYDVKALKTIIKFRKIDEEKLQEEQELVDLYQHALR